MSSINKILKPKKRLLLFYKIKEWWNDDHTWIMFRVWIYPVPNLKTRKRVVVYNFYKQRYLNTWEPSFDSYTAIQKQKNDMLARLKVWY